MKISSTRHLRRQARLTALVEEAGGVTELARLVDTPRSHLSALLSGSKGLGDELAAKLERAMGKAPGWLDHEMSHQPDTIPSLHWEELMKMAEGVEGGRHELPKEFWVILGDDAMAPTAPAGTKVHFTTGQAPRFGDAVLLLGPDGAFHVRQYGQSLSHGFQALPTNPLYAPFHGDMPGVRVVAVLTGIQAGWAQLAR